MLEAMETKAYFDTSPDFVKLRLWKGPGDVPGGGAGDAPATFTRRELVHMAVFLALGMGCLLLTAYVYTQSNVMGKEPALFTRGGDNEEEGEELVFRPCHVMIIRLYNPFSQIFSLLEMDDSNDNSDLDYDITKYDGDEDETYKDITPGELNQLAQIVNW